MNNLSYFIISLILTAQIYNTVDGLSCYSCSTEAGDSFCTEDGFNKKLTQVKCADHSDVCVRAIQISDSNSNPGRAIFRSCGASLKSTKPEVTNLGFSPLYNECILYKILENNVYQNSTFEICSCSNDLGNANGEIKCGLKRK